MLAFITIIGNREHDQDGDSVMKVYTMSSGLALNLDPARVNNIFHPFKDAGHYW